MPDYSQWPTADDVQNHLSGAGFDPSPETVEQSAVAFSVSIAQAIERWETRTNCKPFLAGPTATLRRFDPPAPARQPLGLSGKRLGGGRTLQFETGLALPPTSVMLDALPMFEGEDYVLEPMNALDKKEPLERIRFFSPVWAAPGGIAVTGRWGYATVLPASAWLGVMLSAAALSLSSIRDEPDVAGISEDSFSQEFDAVGAQVPAFRIEQWRGKYLEALKDCRLTWL